MKIIGTGSAIPRKEVSNDDIARFLDTSDEWIFPRTGIRSRHVITVEDINLFICSNVVNEYMTPGLSSIIPQRRAFTAPVWT